MPVKDHSLCIQPDINENKKDDEIKIWRYMDFAQLVSLLENEELFFTRADKLGDPYEGTIPEPHRKNRRESDEIPEKWGEKLLPRFRKICKKYTFLSCWHINNSESAAMWDLYLDADHGVCIQSTYEKLKRALNRDSNNRIHISKVEYIDFESEKFDGWQPHEPLGSSISPFIHKRKNFDYEQELRAIIHDPSWREEDGESMITAETIENTSLDEESLPGNGRGVSIDVDTLIESIHISPDAGEWVRTLLKDIAPYFKLYDDVIADSPMGKEPGY